LNDRLADLSSFNQVGKEVPIGLLFFRNHISTSKAACQRTRFKKCSTAPTRQSSIAFPIKHSAKLSKLKEKGEAAAFCRSLSF
ncbi:hypothetical protein, partial [Eubacterium callanderi]|uniref:hypothetical protein n=1 Tax=Eubacterium callanderi TaxID=53442 RepID=UPI00210BA7AE